MLLNSTIWKIVAYVSMVDVRYHYNARFVEQVRRFILIYLSVWLFEKELINFIVSKESNNKNWSIKIDNEGLSYDIASLI